MNMPLLLRKAALPPCEELVTSVKIAN